MTIIKNNNPYKEPSFSFANRLYRFIWGVFYIVFFRFSPRSFHLWRIYILRLFGASIEKGVHVYPNVDIWAPYNLVMKDYSCLSNRVKCYNVAKIIIGKKTIVSQGSYLCSASRNYSKKNMQLFAKRITLANNVWIAAESFIFPGVNVGEGAVVGARSVVTKDVKDWSVNAGNPCMFIKKRELEDG